MADCFTCPSDHYPNKDKNSCFPKAVVFLSYQEPLGISLAICALSFSLVTALVLSLFIKHHNSPIVKVNNRSLTYALLVSLLLCFLSPLLHIGQPKKVICILRQIFFHIPFTMIISAMLAKTFTVLLAFRATRPGSALMNWVGQRLAVSIILPSLIIETVICTVRLTIISPLPYADMHSPVQEIFLECKEPSLALLFSEMTFLGFLITVNLIVAFHAQKLPDAFNEARFITFSMMVFCCVWLVYIPTFYSTKEKNMKATQIFYNLASSAVLLVFMFFPKCYIILWRPELNSREQLRKWKR